MSLLGIKLIRSQSHCYLYRRRPSDNVQRSSCRLLQ